MPATEIAQVPRVHLEGGDLSADKGKSVPFESGDERFDLRCLTGAGPIPGTISLIPDTIPSANSILSPAYMESFSAIFRICTPCTRDDPPRIAAATWTASVISARFDPFSRDARVYASMQ